MRNGPGDVSILKGKAGKARGRLFVLFASAAASLAVMCLVPPFGQPQAYHHFADKRSLFGVPNFMDVASNAGFLFAGALGMFVTMSRNGPSKGAFFIDGAEKWPYAALFSGVVLTAFGSSYYHLAPSDGTLLWDRLPMALIFASFLAVTVMERINVKAGLVALAPLVAAGVLSVVYWYATQRAGHGDLRPYIFMQFYPMIAIPLMIAMFPPRYTKGGSLLFVIAIYGIARVFEIHDAAVYARLGFAGGHTLKHLIAAAAILPVVVMLKSRAPAPAGNCVPQKAWRRTLH